MAERSLVIKAKLDTKEFQKNYSKLYSDTEKLKRELEHGQSDDVMGPLRERADAAEKAMNEANKTLERYKNNLASLEKMRDDPATSDAAHFYGVDDKIATVKGYIAEAQAQASQLTKEYEKADAALGKQIEKNEAVAQKIEIANRYLEQYRAEHLANAAVVDAETQRKEASIRAERQQVQAAKERMAADKLAAQERATADKIASQERIAQDKQAAQAEANAAKIASQERMQAERIASQERIALAKQEADLKKAQIYAEHGIAQASVSSAATQASAQRTVQAAAAKTGGIFGNLWNRIKRLAGAAFIFNILRRGFTAIRNYAGQALAQNNGVARSIANLKAAAATAAQPLLNALAPALITLANLATRLFSALASVFALITGGSVKASYQQAKAISATGAAAGGAAKSLKKENEELSQLSFDTLNQVSSPTEDTDLGGGGGGGGMDIGFGEEPEKKTGPIIEALGRLGQACEKLAGALGRLGKALWDDFLGPIAETLGGLVVAVIDWVAQKLEDLADYIDQNREKIELFIAVFLTLAAIVGIILGIIAAFTLLGKAIAGLIVLMSSPIGIILTIIGLIALVVAKVVGAAGNTEAALGALKDFITNIVKAVTAFINGDTEAAKAYLKAAFEAIGRFFKIVWESIKVVAKNVWESVKTQAKAAFDRIKNVFKPLTDWFKNKIFEPIKQAIEKVWSKFEWLFNLITGKTPEVKTSIDTNVSGSLEKAGRKSDEVSGKLDTLGNKKPNPQINTSENGVTDTVISKLNTINTTVVRPTIDVNVVQHVQEVHIKANGQMTGMMSVRAYATGAVLPGGHPHLAWLGDQPYGQTNVEAPASLIKDMVVAGLRETGGAGSDRPIQLTVKLNGSLDKLARDLKPALDAESKRKGSSIAVLA